MIITGGCLSLSTARPVLEYKHFDATSSGTFPLTRSDAGPIADAPAPAPKGIRGTV